MVRIPGIEYAAAPRAEQYAAALSAADVRLIVVHDTGNATSNRYGEAAYAANRTDDRSHWTSAHAYIDAGGVLGSLRLDRRAWAAYSYANAHGIHLELCLPGDRTATRRRAAELVALLCRTFGVPAVKLTPSQVAAGQHGICGHRDITLGLGVGDHTDPGADFPWPQFMAWVTGAGPSTEDEMTEEQWKTLQRVERILTAMTTRLMPDRGAGETEDRAGIVIDPWPNGPTVVPNPVSVVLDRLDAIDRQLDAAPGPAQIDYTQLAKALLGEIAAQ